MENSSHILKTETIITTNASSENPPQDAMVTLYVSYVIIMAVSLITNSLLVHIVFSKPNMKTSTNLQFASMAIADLIATILSMPIWSYFICIARDWIKSSYGDILCSTAASASILTSLASIQTLVIISVERFIAIYYPLRRMTLARNTKVATALIWGVSLLFGVPAFFMYTVRKTQHGHYQCLNQLAELNASLRKVYYTFIFNLMFGLPVAIMTVLYVMIGKKLWSRHIPGQQSNAGRRAVLRGRRSVLRMLVVLVVAFVGCWLPVHIEWFKEVFDSAARQEELAIILAHAYSALNPILVFVLNERFRSEILKIVRVCYQKNAGGPNPNLCQRTSIHYSQSKQSNKHWFSVSTGHNLIIQSKTQARQAIPTSLSPAVTLLSMSAVNDNRAPHIWSMYAADNDVGDLDRE